MTADKPMRVLLATDGSERAGTAVDLVGAMAWPPGSTVKVVTVVPDAEFDHEGNEILDTALARLASAMARAANGQLTTTSALLYGRPATRIVHEGEQAQADVIVVGSRGHGTLASMVLGSVAAEVVDRAGRPVLVARRPTLDGVLLAHDGSPCADDAEGLVAEWPIFAALPIDVLVVADMHGGWHLPSTSALYASTAHEYFAGARQVLLEASELADEVADRLHDAGRRASSLMVDGEVAAQIVATAQARGRDLVVVGTHGLTGLPRLMLGSVARNVLLHAPMSVLVACPPNREDPPEA
jgi:nucleotide-binding universal stress UspA family protein